VRTRQSISLPRAREPTAVDAMLVAVTA